jgi:DNA-directed RNA polymerase specialized sigma24 family protein
VYEDIKQRLRNYKKILAKKNEYELQIRDLEEDIGITEPPQGEATGKTYKISSVAENQAIEVAEKKTKLKELIRVNQLEVDHIENALGALTAEQDKVIRLKFIDDRRIESICSIMDKSQRSIKRVIGQGLETMEEILKDDIN